jgi:KUP system potassium uptake protein
MSLGRKGQGGEIVLREIIIKLFKKGRVLGFAGFLSFLGVSLLLGDGVITPAISILSAVEGLLLIPSLAATKQSVLVLIAALIAFTLFFFQSRGTDKMVRIFGKIFAIIKKLTPNFVQFHKLPAAKLQGVVTRVEM